MKLIDRLLSEDNLSSLMVHCARIPYAFLKLLPVRNKVVLISRQNTTTSIDFTMLQQEIHRQHPETKVVTLNHFMTSKLKHIRDILVEMYHLATSRACIIDGYIIAVSILKHKRQLVVVQIWHALGAIKQFGYMTLGKPAGHSRHVADIMNMHGNYTYITCGSSATIPIYQRTFNAPASIIKPIGMPRVDYLLDRQVYQANRQRLLDAYPQLKNKPVILYAPTFRRRSHISPQKLLNHINLKKYAVIIKQHRLDKTPLPANPNLIQIRDEFDSLELLPIADYVITDYSAITFEAALLGKPLFFYAYDYDRYAKDCGFAVDYRREMPGSVYRQASRVVRAIERHSFDLKKVKRFADKWISVQDGTCTKQIVELLPL